MDETAKKVLALLESGDVELRKAAIRVLAEIEVSSKPIILALGRALREPSEDVQLVALKALARLGAGDVSQMVIPLILSTGVVRDHAMIVITSLGPSAVRPLENLYKTADHAGKRSVITALSLIGGKPALHFLLSRLPHETFELQQHIATQVCEALQAMDASKQSAIYPTVARLIWGKSDKVSRQVHITGLILLGYFKGKTLIAKARKALANYAESKNPAEVRRFALLSLNRLESQVKASPEGIKFRLKMLCDDDWENVAQHALAGFREMKVPTKQLTTLVQLLEKSPHFTVHIHVFERLRGTNRAEVAGAIIPFLSDSRFRVREAAESALRQLPAGIEALFAVLTDSDDLDVTQRVNSVLRDFPQETRRKYLDRAVTRLLALFDRKDVRYKSFLEFIRGVDPDPLRSKIYQKAKRLKASKSRTKWAQIANYLQLLWENQLITPDGRYLFAVALLAQSPQRLDPAARRADLGLRVIRALIYDSYEELLRKLLADRDLGAEEYFYLGFHFSEEKEQVGEFGRALLEHVLKKYPRSKLAPQAESKLELQLRLEAEAKARPARRRKSKPKILSMEFGDSGSRAAASKGRGSKAAAVAARARAGRKAPSERTLSARGAISAPRTARKQASATVGGSAKSSKASEKKKKAPPKKASPKKKAPAKKASTKKSSPKKKAPAKKTSPKKKAPAKKTSSKKKAPAKKSSSKKAPAKKAPAKKPAAKKKGRKKR